MIVLEGINDIGYSQAADVGCEAPTTNVTAAHIIGGYQKLIAMAHAHGIKVIGATLTPVESSCGSGRSRKASAKLGRP